MDRKNETKADQRGLFVRKRMTVHRRSQENINIDLREFQNLFCCGLQSAKVVFSIPQHIRKM
jgi:lipoate-protein ligase B